VPRPNVMRSDWWSGNHLMPPPLRDLVGTSFCCASHDHSGCSMRWALKHDLCSDVLDL
jgi:hypothetical protein